MIDTLKDFQDLLETDLREFCDRNGGWKDASFSHPFGVENDTEFEVRETTFTKTYKVKGEEIGFPASVFLYLGNNANSGEIEAKLIEVKRGKDGYTVKYEIL